MDKKTRPRLTVVALLASVPFTVSGQTDFSAVEIEPYHVSGNVYMLVGAGGNMAVSVGEDGVLLVDNQFAPLSDKIQAAVREVGGGDVDYVINTHCTVITRAAMRISQMPVPSSSRRTMCEPDSQMTAPTLRPCPSSRFPIASAFTGTATI